MPPNVRTVCDDLFTRFSVQLSVSPFVRAFRSILVTAFSPVGEKTVGSAFALAKKPPKRYVRPSRCVRPSLCYRVQ